MAAAPSDSSDLFYLLESTNEADVKEIKTLIHENLNQMKEPSYLNSLVDYYMSCSCSTRCQDILVGVREPHDKHLFDKLNDCFKSSSTRFKALTLLGHIVYKQPSWLHKISQHNLLNSLIKILKIDTEIANVMSGCLIIVTLLPVIPSSIGTYLNDIFEAFTRISAWHSKRPANIPETFMMHLHVALYALFHRLYSMYPCNFLGYLRTYCNSNARDHLFVFRETIKPMLDYVRMHPLLVTFSKEAEVSMSRWKKMETHDIVVECAKLSLDPIEGTSEVQNTFEALQSTVKNLRYSIDSGSLTYLQGPPAKLVAIPINDAIVGQAVSKPREDWSPSFSCGLFTPPPFLRECSLQDTFQEHAGSERQTSRIRARTFSGSPTSHQSSVPPSPLRMDGSHFRFPVGETSVSTKIAQGDATVVHSKSAIAVPTPLKLARVPLSKAGLPASSTLSRVTQRLDERHQFKVYEKDDLADSEVASIIEGTCSSQCRETSPSGLTRENTLPHRSLSFSRSGRGSAQWCQSPYLESLQDIQRKRSYSQGKKMPRRATIEVSLRRNTQRAYLSRSLPDLRSDTEGTLKRPEATFGEHPLDTLLNVPFNEKQPGFPYERLFNMALPKAAQESLCPNCLNAGKHSIQQQQQSSSTSLFLQKTPPEMLDRYLQLCNSTQAMKAEAAMKVVQSKDKMQDPRILNGQLQLLHIQLLYERHKREIHAERNRRLLGKVKMVKALEEKNNAMKDQMQLLEKEILTLSENNATLRRNKQQVFDQKDEEIKLAKEELKSATQNQLSLEKSVNELTKQLQKTVEESDRLKKDIQKAQAEIFNTHHELQAIQQQVAQNTTLKLEVKRLSQELLLMTDVNQKYQDKINDLHNYQNFTVEMSSLRVTYTQEVHNLRVALQSRDAQLESTRSRITELEGLLIKKDIVLAEQKRVLKASKEEYEHQIKAAEDKHNARRVICQHLESDILKLHQKIERIRAEEGGQQRGRDMQTKRKSSEKTDPIASTMADVKGCMGATLEVIPLKKDEQPHEDAATQNILLPEITQLVGIRRTSEPIDIEPSFMGASGLTSRCQTQRTKGMMEEEDSSDDSEFQSSKEIVKEERISGALEPITPQSLASIIDIDDYYN